MPRRPPLRLARLGSAGVGWAGVGWAAVGWAAVIALVTGCQGSPLHVAAPQPANAAVPVCNRLNDRLPNLLERLQSRPTRPRSPLVHAWGNTHPVVLRCGVPTPAGFSDSSPSTALVDKVTWFQQVQPRVVVWTAIRTHINVELSVPTHYQGQGAFLVDISDAIAATIP